MDEKVVRNINEDQDSIEIGSPTKGGKIKVYGDFNKKDDFQRKIDCAIELSYFAVGKMEVKK